MELKFSGYFLLLFGVDVVVVVLVVVVVVVVVAAAVGSACFTVQNVYYPNCRLI